MTDLLLDELLIGCLNITTSNFGSTFPEPQSDGNTKLLFSSLNITSLSPVFDGLLFFQQGQITSTN